MKCHFCVYGLILMLMETDDSNQKKQHCQLTLQMRATRDRTLYTKSQTTTSTIPRHTVLF